MGDKWPVRPATADDLAALLGIALVSPSAPQWTSAQYLGILARSKHSAQLRVILIAEEAGVTVGFAVVSALCSNAPAEAELENVAVAPDRRGKGIGGALLQAASDWAALQRADRLRLEVRAGNSTALRLYRAMGFATVGTRPLYYAAPVEDAMCMERKLE